MWAKQGEFGTKFRAGHFLNNIARLPRMMPKINNDCFQNVNQRAKYYVDVIFSLISIFVAGMMKAANWYLFQSLRITHHFCNI